MTTARKYTITVELPQGANDLAYDLVELRLATVADHFAKEKLPKGSKVQVLGADDQVLYTFPRQQTLFPKG